MARSKYAIAFTLVGTVLSSAAHALGLGAIEAKSALNQPLDARIPLISADVGELDSLSVTLASSAAFERAGVQRPFHLAQLKFEVVMGDRPYVRVFTTQPVKEPFLDFFVEANWPRGRLVREYTLLLDPPVFAPGRQAQAVSAATPAAAGRTTQGATSSEGRATATAAVAARAPYQVGTAGAGGASQYGPVKSSDTLWTIANDIRPDKSVSVNQMMVALLQANPDAFIESDMNRLKRGAVLRVPERDVVAQIDAAAANSQVRQQLARWRQDQGIAAPTPSGKTAGQGRLQVVAPTDSIGEQAASSVADRELTPNAETVSNLQRELTLTEEAAISLRAENEELKAQVEALKQQVSSFERLVTIETDRAIPGSALAEPEAVQAPGEQSTAAIETPEPETVEAEPAPTTAEQPAAEEPVAEQPPTPPVEAKPAAVKPKAAPGFFDDPKNLGMLGGVALVLAALGYLLLRRRRGADSEDLVVEQAQFTDESEGQAALQPEVDEFEESAPVPHQDMPPDSDALGEAEVYLAYGRYDQAKDVVTKALSVNPARTDLRLKLLEILALTQDTAGFEEQARALRGQVDAADPAWQRAVEMGQEFIPDSVLFSGGSETKSAPASGNDLDFGDFDFEEPAAGGEQPRQVAAAKEDLKLDFDFDLTATEQASDAKADETVLDFSLDDHSEPALEAVAEFDAEAAADDGLDFQLDEAVHGSDNVLEFALPEAGASDEAAGLSESLDEVGTKLDLARAYLDMGDSDGARSLLDEVLEEGSANQKREAEGLLRQIA